MSHFNEQIRDLIRHNQLDLTFDVLISFAERNRIMDTNFALLQGRFVALEEKILGGLISEEDASLELNQIRYSLVEMFKDMINSMQFDDAAAVNLLEEKKKHYDGQHLEDISLHIPVAQDKKSIIQELFNRFIGWSIVLGIVGMIGLGFFFLQNFYTRNGRGFETPKEVARLLKDSLDKIKNADTLTNHALRLINDERYAEAIKKCDTALTYKTEKPMNWTADEWAEIYNLKAESLLNLGYNIEAEECAKKALALDPIDKEGYIHSTYAQILADKYKEVTPKFMVHFTFALDKKLALWKYMEQIGFIDVKNDPSVKKLLKRYKLKATRE